MTKDYISNNKTKARQVTIIDNYMTLFNSPSLPLEKQYWTICANNSDIENSQILEGSELSQVLQSNLISCNQFYGIDTDSEIIAINQNIIPQCTWICGDFYETLVAYNNTNYFNPGIINCDYLKSTNYGVSYFAKILSFLSDNNISDVMLVCNLIEKAYRFHFSDEVYKNKLETNPLISNAFRHGWKISSKIYKYYGNFSERTKMATIVFYKK